MADASYDGLTPSALAKRLSLPRVYAWDATRSTLDEAHRAGAKGAPAGSLLLADRQTAGRGRAGRSWASEPGKGIWLTMLERPIDAAAIDVLSLRVGLHAAKALDSFAVEPVRLKWPNDLHLVDGKLAGVLIEARWRGDRPDWVAIGVGLNLRRPEGVHGAAALRDGVSRLDVLDALVPALRVAASIRGALTNAELDAFALRDVARGRRCVEPQAGVVQGISAGGELLVATPAGARAWRTGSLILAEPEHGA